MSYEIESWRGYVHAYCYFEPLAEVVGDLTAWMDEVVSKWMEEYEYTFDSDDVWVDNFEIVVKDGKPMVYLSVEGAIEGEGEDDFEDEGDSLGGAIDDDFSGFEDVAKILDRGWENHCEDIDVWYDEDAAYEAWRDSHDD